MIHLGRSKKVRLTKADVRDIEQNLKDVKAICENQLDENSYTDVKKNIGRVEYLIQQGRQ